MNEFTTVYMVEKGFRNPIPQNPIYSKILFYICSVGKIKASDEIVLKDLGKSRVALVQQLRKLYKFDYLKIDGKTKLKNVKYYFINLKKIDNAFYRIAKNVSGE